MSLTSFWKRKAQTRPFSITVGTPIRVRENPNATLKYKVKAIAFTSLPAMSPIKVSFKTRKSK